MFTREKWECFNALEYYIKQQGIDLPSKLMKYTYVAKRIIMEHIYYSVLSCDDITFIAEEGSRAVFTQEEVENDPILRRYYFKGLKGID